MDLYGAGDGRLRERAVEESMETFTCRQQRTAPVVPFVPPDAGGGNHTGLAPSDAAGAAAAPLQRRYNELATLMQVSGEPPRPLSRMRRLAAQRDALLMQHARR